MENYRTSSHSRYDLKYHFVWVTKYRKAVLTGESAFDCGNYIRQQDGIEPADGGDNFQVTKS